MLKSRSELVNYLNDVLKKYKRNKKAAFSMSMSAQERFKITSGEFIDMLSGRTNLDDVSEYHLFCLIYTIDIREETLVHENYFTAKEIDVYLRLKVQDEVEKLFPIIFDCTQTARDQWIGSTSAKFLMQLRNLQLIRYNPETQRSMSRVVKGDKEFFKISIDKTTVENIAQSFRDEVYIADAITLNILPDSEADFFYDADKKQLVVKSIDHFDMTDGFHRYQALGIVSDEIADFDYPMELRITNFNETKAKKYIWQQDQKTKMRKIDSDSLNMDNSAVIVLENLNVDIKSPLYRLLKRNGGNINIAEFANIVYYFYFYNLPKTNHRSQMYVVEKFLNDVFGRMFSYDPTYANKSFSFMELLFTVRVFMNYGNLETERIIPMIWDGIDKVDPELRKAISRKKLNRPLVKKIDDLLEEVAYV